MSRILVTAGRVLASGAVVAGAVAFLVSFGPRATPVYADIYVPLASAAGFLSPPPGGPPLQTGKALVNGQTFRYAIGQSKLELDQLLSHYERQFSTSVSSGPITTAVRVQGAGAGVITGMLFRPLRHPEDLTKRLRGFAETTQLNALGQVHVITAYANQGTVFIDFVPGDDVHLKTLLPAGHDDAPGQDLEGVRRPSGLQRVMTVEHGDGPTWSRTYIYRASDSAAAVADFRGALAAGGWMANPLFDSPVVQHYTNGRQECFVGGAGLGKDAIVILVYRMTPSPRPRS